MAAMTRWIYLFCFVALTVGCGKGGDSPVADNNAPSTGSSTSSSSDAKGIAESPAATATEAPDAIVTRFLEALRRGDKDAVASLLTTAAQQETVRLGYQINPPGDPSSKYQVGRVELADPAANEAFVSSVWTHDLGEGELFSFEAVWIVKRETAGWRVSGLAVKDPQSEEPLVFNFENLEEVFEKKDQVEQAAAEQTPPAAQEAANLPSSNPTSGSLQ